MSTLFKNASWGGAVAAVRLLFGMTNLFLAIKLIGAVSYGYIALIISAITFYVALINSVHTIAVTHAVDFKQQTNSEEKLTVLFSAVWMFTIFGILLIVFAAWAFGSNFIHAFVYWGDDAQIATHLRSALLPMLLIAVFQIVTAGNVAVIESLGRFDVAARAQGVGPIIIFSFLTFFYLKFNSLNLKQVIEILALGAAMDCVLTTYFRFKIGYLTALIPKIDAILQLPSLFKQGLALQGSRLINVFFDPFNKFLLNFYIGPSSVSTYEIAMKITFGIQGLFGGAFRTFLQLTNKMRADGGVDYLKSIHFGLVPALLLHGFGGILIVMITHFWLQDTITSLPLLYLLLIPASMTIIFIAPIYFSLIGIRDLSFIFRMNLNLAVINVIGSLIFIPIIGVFGAAIGFTVAILYNAYMEYMRYIFMIGEMPMLRSKIKSIINRLIVSTLLIIIAILIGMFVKNSVVIIISELFCALSMLFIFLKEPLTKRFFNIYKT